MGWRLQRYNDGSYHATPDTNTCNVEPRYILFLFALVLTTLFGVALFAPMVDRDVHTPDLSINTTVQLQNSGRLSYMCQGSRRSKNIGFISEHNCTVRVNDGDCLQNATLIIFTNSECTTFHYSQLIVLMMLLSQSVWFLWCIFADAGQQKTMSWFICCTPTVCFFILITIGLSFVASGWVVGAWLVVSLLNAMILQQFRLCPCQSNS